jgi:DNA-binding CsgD family transcriptional regulator
MGDNVRARELIDAVEAATRNSSLWPRVLDLLIAYGAPSAELQRLASHLAGHRQLTQAELGVLRHLIAGRTPAEIADAEAVSVSTVRTHIARLHEKFGVSRTLDVVRMAMAEGLDQP